MSSRVSLDPSSSLTVLLASHPLTRSLRSRSRLRRRARRRAKLDPVKDPRRATHRHCRTITVTRRTSTTARLITRATQFRSRSSSTQPCSRVRPDPSLRRHLPRSSLPAQSSRSRRMARACTASSTRATRTRILAILTTRNTHMDKVLAAGSPRTTTASTSRCTGLGRACRASWVLANRLAPRPVRLSANAPAHLRTTPISRTVTTLA